MKIVADRQLCTSAGNCARIAPELFDQGEEDGVVVVLEPEPPPSLAEAAREAESLCPARAITLLDE